MNKKIITIGIGSAIIGAGLLGSYLSPIKTTEVIIEKETTKIPEGYYQKITEGVADKYDLSQIAGHRKLDISYGNNEAYLLIDAWDRKLKESNGLKFTNVNTKDYQKSIYYKMNNYLRYNNENIKLK